MEKYRKELDTIDDKISKLLKKRFEIILKVKDFKKKNKLKKKDSKRENEILKRITKNKNSKLKKYIKNIYKQVFKESVKLY